MAEEKLIQTAKSTAAKNKGTRNPMSSKTQGPQPDLPWWVEILFVQIGLPDSWLRAYLKNKKKAKQYINQNTNRIPYFLIFSVFILYTYPLIKQAQNSNQCISNTESYIINRLLIEENVNANIKRAWASRFCNGGEIDPI